MSSRIGGPRNDAGKRDRSPRDSVDALLDSWHTVRPELDFSPVSVVARLGRVRRHIDTELESVFAAHGLSSADFWVLVTLARIEDEGRVTQRRLMEELGLTSGTISVRMDRLVDAGLIERAPDPASKRNTLITLRPAGRELFERVVPAHLDNERRVLAALTPEQQDALGTLLRTLLIEFEGSRPPSRSRARLGLTLAPAYETIALRRTVGLDPVPGLLVRHVEADGPSARARVQPGDVLRRAGGASCGRSLRSTPPWRTRRRPGGYGSTSFAVPIAGP